MPEQLLPNAFQSQDYSGIWGGDPVLAMVLTFIIVPIGLAVLCIALDSIGRLLRKNTSSRLADRTVRNRFEPAQQLQTAARFKSRRYTLRHPKANAGSEFRRRHRRRARRSKSAATAPPWNSQEMIRERLEVTKRDLVQRRWGEREEPLSVRAVGPFRGGLPALQPLQALAGHCPPLPAKQPPWMRSVWKLGISGLKAPAGMACRSLIYIQTKPTPTFRMAVEGVIALWSSPRRSTQPIARLTACKVNIPTRLMRARPPLAVNGSMNPRASTRVGRRPACGWRSHLPHRSV